MSFFICFLLRVDMTWISMPARCIGSGAMHASSFGRSKSGWSLISEKWMRTIVPSMENCCGAA